MRSFKIGNVLIPGNLILGPMAGVTDLPFRLLCKEQGADLVYTEMISAKGIYYNNKNTEKLWEIADEEHPAALQLFGSDPDLMAEMARKIDHRNFDILDINMGCPVPKVVNNGEGSALMKTPELAAEIEKEIPEFCYRLKMKAGLTGYAQVYGKYNTTSYDKLKLDLTYIRYYSLLLALKLILMTP